MSRTIHVNILDSRSIDNAIRELKEYQQWIQRKADELRQRVAELIRNKAELGFLTSISGDYINEEASIGGVTVDIQDNGDVTLVVASGKDAVFIEFGAGVYHNGSVGSSPHPLGVGLGFTIGSYSPNSLGRFNIWGFTDENGELHLTHGAPASMPLYKALMEVRQDIVQIAREVFNS